MELDLGSKNTHSLEFTTRDISSLVKLLDAVKQIRKDMRLGFNKKGLYMNEFGCNNALVFFATLHQSEFDSFKTSGTGVIGLNVVDLLRVLKNNSMDDRLCFSFNHKKPDRFKIEILRDKKKSSDDNSYAFEMKTQYLDEEEHVMYTAMDETYDAEAKVSARDVQSFITSLISIENNIALDSIPATDYSVDGFVYLSVNEYMIVLEKGSGTVLDKAKIVMLTQKGRDALVERGQKRTKEKFIDPFKRCVLPNTIKKQLMLKYMHSITKFFLLNPNKDATLTVLMKKDPPTYPVVFGVNVGDLGFANIALSPFEEEED